jgi:dihydrofolate reductase
MKNVKGLKCIIAVNNLGYIGLNGGLPWKNSADLQHFKNLTMGASLLVGHNTAKNLPKLSGRTIILDERDSIVVGAGWCIGGKKTYERYSRLFTELHISHINDNTIGDTMFPDLSDLSPDCEIFNYYFG